MMVQRVGCLKNSNDTSQNIYMVFFFIEHKYIIVVGKQKLYSCRIFKIMQYNLCYNNNK